MTVRLLAEQVNQEWETIGGMIAEGLPPYTAFSYEGMVNVLYAILNDIAQVWGYYGDDEKLKAVIVTTVHTDPLTRVQNLLVYSMFSLGDMTLSQWQDMLHTLKVYGKSKGCVSVIGFTNNSSVVKLVRHLHGDVSYAMIEFPL